MLPDLLSALGAAANDVALPEQSSSSSENWFCISPYGEFPNVSGLQICDRTAGERMVKHFGSLAGRVGRLFRGLPIYVGHPDYPPVGDDYPDKTVYGHLNALEARGDGLYGKPDWTEEGKSMVNEKDFLYPSPHWRMEPIPGRPYGFRPVRLVSVGLTNSPNIQGDPLPAQNAQLPPANPPTMQLNTFLDLLSLPADAADEQVTARLTQLRTDADARAAAEQRAAAANTRVAAAEQLRDEVILTAAINDGRILSADRDAWAQSLTADFTAAVRDLSALRPALNIAPRLAALGQRREEMTFDVNGVAALNQAVAREMRESGEPDRNKAWSALKQRHPELFQQN